MRSGLLVAGLLAVLLLSAWFRLRTVGDAAVGSDSIGQFFAAWAWSSWPAPPNPESGRWLWVTAVPDVLLASSLQDAFVYRFVQGALIAPVGAVTAWQLAKSRPVFERVLAAGLSGVFLALDPGLVDTLVSSFRGYGAPEWIALAGLGFAFRERLWGIPLAVTALMVASGHHPFATGALVAGLLLLALLRVPRKTLLMAVGIAFVLAIPRLQHIFWLGNCGDGIRVCLETIALGSSQLEDSRWALLQKAVHDRFLVDLGPAGVMFGLGCLLALFNNREAGLWALVALFCVIALALIVHSLRPYHLREVAAPMGVATGLVLSRLRWLGLLLGVVLSFGLLRQPVPPGSPGAVSRHDSVAKALGDLDGTLWIEGAWTGDAYLLEPSGVVLAALLQGQDPARFVGEDPAHTLLALSGAPPQGYPVLVSGEGWSVLSFESQAALQAWAEAQTPAIPLAGAMDWLMYVAGGSGD